MSSGFFVGWLAMAFLVGALCQGLMDDHVRDELALAERDLQSCRAVRDLLQADLCHEVERLERAANP